MMLTVHTIKLDTDEGRFTLSLDTYGDEGTIVVDIHDVALDLYEQVRRELLPYVHEAEQARAAVASGTPRHVYLGLPATDDEDTGYAPDDPKSPGFHERMVD